MRFWCAASGWRAADPPGALFSSGALCPRGRWSSFIIAIAVGSSGAGETHVALVHELMEARDERRLLNLPRQRSRLSLLLVDELGFVPLSRTGAELLFEVFSQRYERGSILVTTNLPFDKWTEVFGSERLTGALPDRLTHHVHILEMNGESYRLKHSGEPPRPKFRKSRTTPDSRRNCGHPLLI